MKDESQYVVVFDDDEESFVGTLDNIKIWLDDNDLTLSRVSIYRLSKVRLVLAVEDIW